MALLAIFCICHKDSLTIPAQQSVLENPIDAMVTSPEGTSNTLVFPARQLIQHKLLLQA